MLFFVWFFDVITDICIIGDDTASRNRLRLFTLPTLWVVTSRRDADSDTTTDL